MFISMIKWLAAAQIPGPQFASLKFKIQKALTSP